MNGATKRAGGMPETISSNPLRTAQRILLALGLLAIGFSIVQTFIPGRRPISGGFWEAAVLLLVLASTLASISGQLPAQNVLLGSAVIACIGGGIHCLGGVTGIPFGPLRYTSASGPTLLGALPWFMPLLWIIVILNARGVARLILRPWRKLRVYGYWLIGITAALTLVFVLGLEPFATHARHYWVWHPTKLPVSWYGAPLSNFLGWVVTALLILAFSTPALMKKRPARSYPEYHPLIIWTAINLLFVAGSLSQHLLAAALVSAIGCMAVIPFAIRGARW